MVQFIFLPMPEGPTEEELKHLPKGCLALYFLLYLVIFCVIGYIGYKTLTM